MAQETPRGAASEATDERAHLLPRVRVPSVEAESITDAPPWPRRTRWIFIIVSFVGLLVFVVIFNDWPPYGLNRQGFAPCPEDTDLECGFIRVPRNYFNESEGTTDIYIARYSAHPRRRIGSLFINFGGPGNPASTLALLMGKPFSRLFNGRYDIVGFDSRGVGKTQHAVACFPTWADYQALRAGTVLSQGFNVPPDPFSDEGRAIIEAQYAEWLALTQVVLETCMDAPGSEDIKYMSSATVARDIDYMTTVLDGKDALINYWGPSYGSVLGNYLVNMFPDRVGRVAIDGVMDAQIWANEPSYKWLATMLHGVEANYAYVLRKCGEAGPEHCALAESKGESSSAIAARVDAFLDQVFKTPVAVPHGPRPGIITSGMVRALLYMRTSQPTQLPRAYEAVSAAMGGNYTQLAELTISPISTRRAPLAGDVARQLISCMDQPPYDPDHRETWPTAAQLTDESLRVLKNVSPRFGMSVSLQEPDGGCEFLAPLVKQAPERFSGPFNRTLRSPILIASADLDPITPLLHARTVNNRFGNSSKLVISENTPAHSNWYSGPSMCMAKAYRDYFASGILPDAKETLCPTDVELFGLPSEHGPDGDGDPELREVVMELRKVWNSFLPA